VADAFVVEDEHDEDEERYSSLAESFVDSFETELI
jgi:hypothetical protein